ncbi:MAG: RNA polymerase subunit sigma [Gammaproteobacteria bacterium HGW-Gammaproteobacteria-11]|nr:MAG: RNA polymerase subunit sigma [Gammaproteobacteria bacterium HGW-Gammaproteobacteria-11]
MAMLLLVQPVQADEARQWLSRMSEAARLQSYQGAFVYERTGSFSTHLIWRQVEAEDVTERLLQSDGDPQEWIRHNGELLCTSSTSIAADWADATLLAEQPDLLHNWYTLQILGETRVANRPVTVLAVKPRDPFRYAYELYLDTQTGLLLKSLLINEREVLLERFQFTSLSLDPIDPLDLEPGEACKSLSVQSSNLLDNSVRWIPTWLPSGFALGHSETRELEDDGQLFVQVFTDGLARFTLFIESLGDQALADDLRAQLGPTVAVSRKLATPEGDFLVTVVGEIPPLAAERVADSLRRETDGGLQ